MQYPGLSSTQLVWAGIATDTTFVLYKKGGLAPHQCLLILVLDEGRVAPSIKLSVPYCISDVKTLKDYVQSKKATIIN